MKRLLAVVAVLLFNHVTAQAAELLIRVDTVKVTRIKGGLRITADGWASKPGWKNIKLQRMPSPTETLAYEFVGDPPSGIVPDVLTRAHATTTWKGDPSGLSQVSVKSKTNTVTIDIASGKVSKAFISAGIRSTVNKSSSTTVSCTCGDKTVKKECPSDKNNTCDCSDPKNPKVICGS